MAERLYMFEAVGLEVGKHPSKNSLAQNNELNTSATKSLVIGCSYYSGLNFQYVNEMTDVYIMEILG